MMNEMPIPWCFCEGGQWFAVPRLPLQLAATNDLQPPIHVSKYFGERLIVAGPHIVRDEVTDEEDLSDAD